MAQQTPIPTDADADESTATDAADADAHVEASQVLRALETLQQADNDALSAAIEEADTETVAEVRTTARDAEKAVEAARKAVDGEIKTRGGTDAHEVVEGHNKFLTVEDERALQALQQAGGDPETVTEIKVSDLASEAERLGMDVEVLIGRHTYEYVRSQ